MEKKEVKDVVINAVICGSIFGISSVAIRSCQNKNDMRKYYANAENNTSAALIIDGKLYIYDNPSDMHFMPNNAYLSKSFNDSNNNSGVNYIITDERKDIYHSFEITYHKEIEYNINYLDSKTMVIYTYSDDESSRELLTRYILSNITVDDENTIIFNKNDITSEGFKEYKSRALSVDNSENIEPENTQRTRSIFEE